MMLDNPFIWSRTARWRATVPGCWGFPGFRGQQHWASYPLMHWTGAGMSCMKNEIKTCVHKWSVYLLAWHIYGKTVLPSWLLTTGSFSQSFHFKKLCYSSSLKWRNYTLWCIICQAFIQSLSVLLSYLKQVIISQVSPALQWGDRTLHKNTYSLCWQVPFISENSF